MHVQASGSQMLHASHRLEVKTKSGPLRVESFSPRIPWAEGVFRGAGRAEKLVLRAALLQSVPFSAVVI